MTGVRFDDLDALQGMVSEDWGSWSHTHVISQGDVTAFGQLTDDMQWIHVDPRRAQEESPLGTTIAHGFLLLSLLPSLKRSTGLDITGHGSALNYGMDRLRFIGPVRVGSEIYCRTRLEAVAQRPAGTMIDLGVAVHIVDEEKPSITLLWKLLYRK